MNPAFRWLPALLVFAALVAFAASISSTTVGSAEAYTSSEWLEGASGYEKALGLQKQHKTPVLLYFRVDWCPHCRTLDGMLEEKDFRSRLKSLIKVRVNPEKGPEEQDLFDTFGGSAFPTIFLSPAASKWTQLRYSPEPEELLAQLPKK